MAKKAVKKKRTKVKRSAAKIKTISAPSEEVLIPEIVEPESLPVVPSTDEKALAPSDPLTRYLAEIRKYPVLSREEEQEIAIRYKETGDPKLAEILVTSNLRFVVKVAAEYTKFGAKLIDLIQEGNVGLMHAVRDFNPYKGVRLISYAVWWIRGYIQEFLMRQYSLVRIGTTQNQRKLFYQLQKQREEIERLGGGEVIAQLSGRLGVSEEEVVDMSQRLASRDVSLDQPVGDNHSASLIDLQSDQERLDIDDRLGHQEELQRLSENIESIRPQLNDRELFLLESRLLADEPLTLQEIGDKYGITREAVRQLESRLISKIKKQMLSEN